MSTLPRCLFLNFWVYSNILLLHVLIQCWRSEGNHLSYICWSLRIIFMLSECGFTTETVMKPSILHNLCRDEMSPWPHRLLFSHQQQVCKQRGSLWSLGCLSHSIAEGHQEGLLPGQTRTLLFHAILRETADLRCPKNLNGCILDAFLERKNAVVPPVKGDKLIGSQLTWNLPLSPLSEFSVRKHHLYDANADMLVE